MTTRNQQIHTTMLRHRWWMVLAVMTIALTATTSLTAQRKLMGGEGLVLDDGTASPQSITIASPSDNHYVGARCPSCDSLLFSWVLYLPIGPAPQGTATGGTVNTVNEDRYFFVADTAGKARWMQAYLASLFWDITGNAATSPGVGGNYAGTGDSTAFEIHIDNAGLATEGRQRVLRIDPAFGSPNFLGGFNGNTLATGSGATILEGVAIHGGGATGSINQIGSNTADYSTIGGGAGNTVSGYGAAIPGGFGNTASGQYALAMGQSTTSTGTASVAGGSGTRATANYAVALGNRDTAGAQHSLAIGDSNRANGQWSAAIGSSVSTGGNAGLALGQYLSASANNSMAIGKGNNAGSRLTNSTASSLIVGFNTLGTPAGNAATLAVVGTKVGVGLDASSLSSTSPRMTVRSMTNNGVTGLPTDSSNYVVDISSAGGDTLGSHFFIRQTPNAGYYNPGGTAVANGAIIGIADPIDGGFPNHTGDTARLMVRGWGRTDTSYAMFIHDSTGTVPLFGIRDDGKMQLKTAVIDEFEGFNFNGDVGPAISGIRGSSAGFDLGGCNDSGTMKRWTNFYVDGQIRFDYYRGSLRYNSSATRLEFAIFDTSVAGTLDVIQNSQNGTWSPSTVDSDGVGTSYTPVYTATQTFTPGGSGAIDSIDVYFTAFTPNTQIILALAPANSNNVVRVDTITTPATSSAGYLSFVFTAYNMYDCGSRMQWTVTSDSAFTLAYYDRTSCVTGNASDRARFDYIGDAGWSNQSGIYPDGRADITTSTGDTAAVIQRDTLCGATNFNLDTCRTGGTLCGGGGVKTPGSYIQPYPAGTLTSSVLSTSTYPIDYRFRTYRIKTPSPGISIAAAANRRVLMGQGTTAAQGQLDVQSKTGALIPPRMTGAQRTALPTILGSIVFQTNTYATDGSTPGLYGYTGTGPFTGWKKF